MNADKIIAYMISKGYRVTSDPGCWNIVYVEGVNSDGTPNGDPLDQFNDRRLLIHHTGTAWEIYLNVRATTEPGAKATFSAGAARRGGVARIAFGQYLSTWKLGYHKGDPNHPALMQIEPVLVHRDKNRDGIRTGDKIESGLFGINQHGTPGRKSTRVGSWSEGCLVGMGWEEHLLFISLLKEDPRWQTPFGFAWDTTIINGDELFKFNFQPTQQ
ncbi:MAG: hypothetical protein JNM22_01980 [Saprospiraceae bacterium]|nr:hypothetical protein [Saprospiraceae bacterium]